MVAEDLARQPDAREALRGKPISLGHGHRRRFPVEELHATRGAARVSAAGVEDVDLGVLFDGEHEALAVGHVHCSETFNREFGHQALYFAGAPPVARLPRRLQPLICR